MRFTVYKTTNLINEKYYIGVHKTKNPYDSYLGSGTLLRRAILKYGVENFKKEIITICDTEEDAYKIEQELVCENIIDPEYCYNLKRGGFGGWDYVNKTDQKQYNILGGKNAHKKYMLKTPEERSFYGKKANDTAKLRTGKYSFEGKVHTEETKQKMRESMLNRFNRDKNSQYGTCWITKDGINKKINKNEIIEWECNEWSKGRTC